MKKILMLTFFLLFFFVNNTFATTISVEEFESRTSTYYSNEILPIVMDESYDVDMRSYFSGLDINSFVQAVLTESYQETSAALQDYADQVKIYLDLRDTLRGLLEALRNFRNDPQKELEFELMPYLMYMDSNPEPTIVQVGSIDTDSLNTVNQLLSNSRFNNFDFTVPEPKTMLLFGFGLLGLAGVSRRKNNSIE